MCTKLKSLILIASVLFTNQVFSQAVITIYNDDVAGVGFNDNTPITRIEIGKGGNFATTIGQARLNALQYAVNKLSNKLNSSVEIDFISKFADIGGSSTAATLARTRVASFHANFVGAPRPDTLYHSALANMVSGSDLAVNGYDLSIEFNGSVDGAVLGSRKWYYGFDANPKNNDIDFVTVSTHEILHGLGFSAAVNPSTGEKGRQFRFSGKYMDDVYMLNLEWHGAVQPNYSLMIDGQRKNANVSELLHWVGAAIRAKSNGQVGFQNGHAAMYAPPSIKPGSSVSHFSTLFSSVVRPGEMMEPNYTGPDHDIGLSAQVLEDIGWGKLNSNSNLSNKTDLSIDITNPTANLSAGMIETYSVSVTNKGTPTATGIVVTNFLPDNSSFISVIPASGASCDQTYVATNRIVSCSLASLPPSGTAIFNITLKINRSGKNTFSANVETLNIDTIFTNNNSINRIAAVPEQAPVILPIAAQSVEAGQTVNITVIAADPNGGVPAIQLLTNIPNTSLAINNDGTATFTWFTKPNDIGETPIVFKATDKTNLTDTKTVNITVTKKIVTPPSGTGGGSTTPARSNNDINTGGCTISATAKFDPLFPSLFIFLSILYIYRKRVNI